MAVQDYTVPIAVGVAGAIVVAAVAVYELYFAPRPGPAPPSGVATLVLSGPTSSAPGVADEYSVLATDASGKPVASALLYFFVNGVQQTSGLTNDSGILTFTYTPAAAGTYTVYASTE